MANIKFHEINFPDPENSDSEGLVAYGGDLSIDMLISAYQQGIFPWFNEGDPILWWSPDPRMILYPKDLKISKSFRQSINKKEYQVKADFNFKQVIEFCSRTKRKEQAGTWISEDMIKAYYNLHKIGIAHSIEVYEKNSLVGGLYGLAIGKVFFGESMFHTKRDASKIALFYLCQLLIEEKFHFIDVQQSTSHLKSLGAIDIKRSVFLEKLKNAMSVQVEYSKWHFKLGG